MKKLADLSTFESLAQGAIMSANISQFELLSKSTEQPNLGIFIPDQSQLRTVENDGFDVTIGGTQPVKPANPIPGELPPAIPQWGQSLRKKVSDLENEMKAGFAEIRSDLTEIKQSLTSKNK